MTLDRERDREPDRERMMSDIVFEEQQRNRQILARPELMEMHAQSQREQDGSPRENHTGSIPLQQPVPSRGQGTLHGPNGILAHLNAASGPSAQSSAVVGTSNVFLGNAQPASDGSPRSLVQQPVQSLPHQQLLGGFSHAVNNQQLPNGMAALSQGQQPILNVRILPSLGYLLLDLAIMPRWAHAAVNNSLTAH